ncbi:MAG: hypothetical protein CMJ78_05840 [Planctomycetaceae bacterium]|nr:hypothetical protein [Planctomycetaceae bacterium]
MNLEQFVERLEDQESFDYQALVREYQNGADSKNIRGRLARLAITVLKRLDQPPNPGTIIAQFIQLYPPDQSATTDQSLPAAEMKPVEDYPQALVQPMVELDKSKDPASTHKALLDLGEALLVYLTGIQFGEYRKSWPIDEQIEAEFYKNAKRKPSFGVFLGFLRRLVKAEGQSILDHLFHKQAQFEAVSEYVLVYDLLSQVINQGQDDNFQPAVEELKQGRTVAKRNLINFYDSFISMRNSYAHPEDKAKNPERKWPLGQDYYNLINPYVQAGLEELIANLVVITEYQPILVEEVDPSQHQGQVLIEVGRKGKGENLSLQEEEIDFLDPDLRFLLDREGRPFSRLYYNELPQLSPSVAKKIISQEKAKMLEPVLKGMIKEYLSGDGEIDQDEYLTLCLTAQSADVDEEELRQIISQTREEGGLSAEFEIIDSHQVKDTGPHFKDWWLKYFLLRQGVSNLYEDSKISTVRRGKVEEEGTTEYFHRMVWDELNAYATALKEKYLDDESETWILSSNQWQQGRLTGYYWGRIYPEESTLGQTYSVSIFTDSINIVRQYQRIQRILDEQKSLGLIEASTQICADFLEENREALSEFEVWVTGWNKNLVPDFRPEYDYFLHELFPTQGSPNGDVWKRHYTLNEYYDSVHPLALEGKFIIYELSVKGGIDKSSARYQDLITNSLQGDYSSEWGAKGLPFELSQNPEGIDRGNRIGIRLFSGIISKINDYAIEKGIYLAQNEGLKNKKYELAKPSLVDQVRSETLRLIVNNTVCINEYNQLLKFIHQNNLKYMDFLKVRQEFEEQGIVFLDGAYVNQLSPEKIESMNLVLDCFVSQYEDKLIGRSDSNKRRQGFLQKSKHYSICVKGNDISTLIGFRWTNTSQVYAILQFEGHYNHFRQADAFLDWVNQHPDWVSVNPDGSYRLHLHSGRKVFSIEKQEQLPTWPWSEEQIHQIIQIMGEMLPLWEQAKSQLVTEPPQAANDTNN